MYFTLLRELSCCHFAAAAAAEIFAKILLAFLRSGSSRGLIISATLEEPCAYTRQYMLHDHAMHARVFAPLISKRASGHNMFSGRDRAGPGAEGNIRR